MKRTAAVLSVAAVALWSAGVFAQGRNFAGTWTIDSEKTSAAAAAAGAGGIVTAGGGGGATMVARSGGGGGGFGGGGGGTSSGGAVAASGSGGAVMRSGGGGGGGMAAAGGVGGGGGARGSVTSSLTITIDASTFRVGSGESGTSYRLDGVPTTAETPRGTSTMKATWKDDKLVIETTNPGPNGSTLSVATWYLEGDSLVRESNAIMPDGTQTPARKTYYKRS